MSYKLTYLFFLSCLRLIIKLVKDKISLYSPLNCCKSLNLPQFLENKCENLALAVFHAVCKACAAEKVFSGVGLSPTPDNSFR